jgi:hypothetical protein
VPVRLVHREGEAEVGRVLDQFDVRPIPERSGRSVDGPVVDDDDLVLEIIVDGRWKVVEAAKGDVSCVPVDDEDGDIRLGRHR